MLNNEEGCMITVDTILELANQLSLIDKIRLIEGVAAQLVQELPTQGPRKSLRGLWQGVDSPEEELRAVRQEMSPTAAEDEDHVWSQFSLQMAVNGLEEEEIDDYTLADIQKFFTPMPAAADPTARQSTDEATH